MEIISQNYTEKDISMSENTTEMESFQYEIIDKIASNRNNITTIYRARLIGKNQIFALKVLNLKKAKKSDIFSFQREIYSRQKIDHPGVNKIIDCFKTSSRAFLVLELADKDLLTQILKRTTYNISQIQNDFQQILSAVNYLHHNYIAHCDLKLENILLMYTKDEYMPVLTDFGFSKQIDQNDPYTSEMCGTVMYISPEIANIYYGGPKAKWCPFKSDIWALGIILYVMLTSKFPYENPKITLESNWSISNSQDFQKLDPITQDFLEKMLARHPLARFNTYELLRHPWLFSDRM